MWIYISEHATSVKKGKYTNEASSSFHSDLTKDKSNTTEGIQSPSQNVCQISYNSNNLLHNPRKLTDNFFAKPCADLAKALLGKRVVRLVDGERISGRIVETEAYPGQFVIDWLNCIF